MLQPMMQHKEVKKDLVPFCYSMKGIFLCSSPVAPVSHAKNFMTPKEKRVKTTTAKKNLGQRQRTKSSTRTAAAAATGLAWANDSVFSISAFISMGKIYKLSYITRYLSGYAIYFYTSTYYTYSIWVVLDKMISNRIPQEDYEDN
jgi:hypothetical protein